MVVICGNQCLTKIAAIFFSSLLACWHPLLGFLSFSGYSLFFCLISADYCVILWLLLDHLRINQQQVYIHRH